MHRQIVFVVSLFLAVAATTSASARATDGGLRLGIQDDAWFTADDPVAWSLASELHPKIVRFNVNWATVAPERPFDALDPADPAYRFSSTDALVRRARKIGATVLLTIVQTPSWASGAAHPVTVPLSADDFGAFCRAVATRYDGHHGPPRVSYYTVWNEPNRGQYLRPQGIYGLRAPKALAGMMNACVPAIHAANDAAKVALGPLASRGAQHGLAPLAFLRRYAAAKGIAPEVIALNPYQDGLPVEFAPRERTAGAAVTLRNLDQLEAGARSLYGHDVPVWLTEFAWRTGSSPDAVSPDEQAALAEQSVALVREHYPYVKMLIWFLLRDVSAASYWQSGLVDSKNQRKPVFSVWQRLASTP